MEYGTLLIRLLTPFYVVNCVSRSYGGTLCGIGQTWIPIVKTFPLGWFICSAGVYLYYWFTPPLRNGVPADTHGDGLTTIERSGR